VWNLCDFTSYWRHEGGLPGLNTKGLVTFDRHVKKDAFYFYQANWATEPMIHITDRRFTDRTNAVTNVKIYSNAARAELVVNGASLGTQNNDGNGSFRWQNVRLTPGENVVEAHAEKTGKKVHDECRWMLKAGQ